MKNNSFMKMLKGNSGIIAVLVIISIILSFASPVFLTTDNLCLFSDRYQIICILRLE